MKYVNSMEETNHPRPCYTISALIRASLWLNIYLIGDVNSQYSSYTLWDWRRRGEQLCNTCPWRWCFGTIVFSGRGLQTLHWLRTSISNEGIRYDRASIKRKLCTEGASKSKRWPRECIQIKEFAMGVYPNHVVAPGNTLKSRQEVSPGYDPPSARHFSVL